MIHGQSLYYNLTNPQRDNLYRPHLFMLDNGELTPVSRMITQFSVPLHVYE